MSNLRLSSGFLPVLQPDNPVSKLPVWLWVLVAAGVAALIMPRTTPFPYHYERQQPWNHPTLKAPFDFEVLHPEEKVRDAVERIQNDPAPYCIVQPEVLRQQKKQFGLLLDQQVRISQNDAQYEDLIHAAGAYEAYGNLMLEALYERGILDQTDNTDNLHDSVFLVEGNSIRRYPMQELYTLKTARDFLTDSLPYSPLRQPELILPILEKVLIPNILFSDSMTIAGKRKMLQEINSTGITVRRSEVIAQRGQMVTDEVFLKLNSLERRYDAPKSAWVLVGFFLLALLAFGALVYGFMPFFPQIFTNKNSFLLILVFILGHILLVNLFLRIGAAVPLLLPIYATPVLLRYLYPVQVQTGIWAVFTLLIAVSLDWGTGWWIIQTAGYVPALMCWNRMQSWTERFRLAGITAFVQSLAWLGTGWSGRLSEGLRTPDVVMFFLIAALLSLSAYPLGNVLKNQSETP